MTGRSTATLLLFSLSAGGAAAKDTWIEARSENFTILTDAGKGTAGNILEDLEQLRRLIRQVNPQQRLESSHPAGIYAFRNEKSMRSFQPLHNGKPEDLTWMFRPTLFKSFVALRAEGGRDWVREVVFQNYLHLIMSYGSVPYPLWLENGFSLFYGNANFTKTHGEVGKMHDRHRRELGEFRAMPLQQLFAVSYDSPEYNDATRRALVDAQSWALMHYLLIGRNPEGAKALDRFMRLLAEGGDPLLAFQEALGMPVSEIDAAVSMYIRKSIYQYWKVELPPPLESAREFRFTELAPEVAEARLGELLIAVGRFEEARARLSAAVEAAPDLPDAYEGLGFLSVMENSPEDALTFLERAVSKGSGNPIVHYHYARILLDRNRGSEIPEPVRERALASLAKTLESDPSHAEAARLFGYLRLFDGSAQEGVDVVKKALESNPGNPYLLFILGQLYGRQENYSAARAVYENLLSRKLEPQFVADVRRQLDWVVAKMATP